MGECLLHRGRGVECFVFLGVVTDDRPVTGVHRPGVRCIHPREDPKQGRLARTIEAQDHDPRALVDSQIDISEDLEASVGA